MFERFTPPARVAVVQAQDDARALGHGWIGTVHVLLGLLRAGGDDPVARTLARAGITYERLRGQLEHVAHSGAGSRSAQLPFTPRAKAIFEHALRESLDLGHDHVGPEHLLLGIARENEGVAAITLRSGGLDAERLRTIVIAASPASAPRAG